MSTLPVLEQRIKEKIQQAKGNIHPTHNRLYLEKTALIISLGAIFMILNTTPNAFTHFAKASSCTASSTSSVGSSSKSTTGPGSCATSTGGSAFIHPSTEVPHGGKNSCSSNSFGKTADTEDTTNSGNSISCNSHTP